MAAKILHKKSNTVTNGVPSLPSPSILDYGEIAINYHEGNETISIKNDAGNIATFKSSAQIEGEYVAKSGDTMNTGATLSLSYHDDNNEITYRNNITGSGMSISDVEGEVGCYAFFGVNYITLRSGWQDQTINITPSDIKVGASPLAMNTLSFPATSGTLALTSDIPETVTALTSACTNSQVPSAKAVYDTIADNEYVVATVLNNLNTEKEDVSNKVTAITSSATQTQYPSALAVYNYVQSQGDGNNAITGVTVNGTLTTVTDKVAAVVLPTAATNAYGIIKVGSFLSASNGVVSVSTGTSSTTVARGNHTHSNYVTSAQVETQITGKGYITGYTETDPTVPAWAKAENKPSYTASEVGALASGTTLDGIADGSTRKLSNYSLTSHTHSNYVTSAQVETQITGKNYVTASQLPDVSNYFDGAEYDSTNKRINFKHGSTVKAYVDATDFIKDGMVSNVAITTPTSGANSGVTCLVVSFNTDAGKDDIEIPLTNIFNPNNYYTKTETDARFLPLSGGGRITNTSSSSIYGTYGSTSVTFSNTSTQESTEYGNGSICYSNPTDDNEYYYRFPAFDGTVDTLVVQSQLPTEASIAGSGFTKNALTAETDPTVPAWAKAANKPTYTASEVGALATGTTLDGIADGTTRKLSNYSLTSHTHSNYVTSGQVETQITGKNYVTSGQVETQIAGRTLPTVTASDNGKILRVVNGAWALVDPVTVYTGASTPSSSLGEDGDIYLQTD